MMHMLDLQIGVALVDQLTESDSAGVNSHVGHLDKTGLQRCQVLSRGLGPGMLIPGEDHFTLIVHYRDEGAVEATLFDRPGRALLAFKSEGIDLRASDSLHGGNRIGAQTLMRLRMALTQAQVSSSKSRRLEPRRRLFLAH